MEARAGGLLDPVPGPLADPIDPSKIEDPALRRMMEQISRRER